LVESGEVVGPSAEISCGEKNWRIIFT